MLAGAAHMTPRKGRFAGDWEHVSGRATITCNGKVAKEQSLVGKRFKIIDDGGALRFSDEACDYPLKVDGDKAVAAVDSCVPKSGGTDPVKIARQTLEAPTASWAR